MIYIVLGMHKSGTTLLSTMLHKSGINMGEGFSVGTYDTGNQYERDEVYQLNLKLLGSKDDQTLKLKAPANWMLSVSEKNEMQEVVDCCEEKYEGIDWGAKEPRTCLTYKLWQEVLPKHKVIGIFRRPEQIWPRYRWKGWRRRYVNLYWAWLFLNRWYEYNEGLIDAVNENESIVIEYQEFMTDGALLDQLSVFTGRKLLDERRASMHRSKKGYDAPLFIAKYLLLIFKGRSVDRLIDRLYSAKAG